jgi:hypothetical protein
MASEPETFPVRSGEDVVKARQIVRSRAMELLRASVRAAAPIAPVDDGPAPD